VKGFYFSKNDLIFQKNEFYFSRYFTACCGDENFPDNHRKITLYRDLDFVVKIFIVFLLDPNLTKEQMPHCINGLRASVFLVPFKVLSCVF
jgi:hypothetical protein